MRSIKTKLIFGISLLLIFLFSITGYLLITEKAKELANDIYVKARSFSELTTPKIVDLQKTYLAQHSFVIFNREMKDVFKKDEDIAAIKIATYKGEWLYDSETEKNEEYDGATRVVNNSNLQARIQAKNPSALIEGTNRVVYFKKDQNGNVLSVDENEKPVPAVENTERLADIVVPHGNEFAVVFTVSYKNLDSRVRAITERLVYLLIFGLMIGLTSAYFVAARLTDPVKKLTESAIIIGRGDFSHRVYVKTKDEIGTLSETFNTMAKQLEISTKAMIYKERVAKELEVAAKIQKEILPKTLPKISDLDVAAYLIPAVEIGGDCYDFVKLDETSHLIYVGDVTGHGVPSGLVVSIANALLYSVASEPSLKKICEITNRVLKAKTSGNMFITLLMLRWNTAKDGVVEYISAGHPEMVHYSAAQKKTISVPGGGIALGMFPDISKNIETKEMHIDRGDCLVLYSDGIPEAASENGKEMYGVQRLKRAVNEYAELPSAEAIQKALLADVKTFMGKSVQNDDITIVVLKRK